MKTIEEIKESVCQERFRCNLWEALPQMDTFDIFDFTNDVAEEYATEAIKADRERVAENAKTTIAPNPRYDKKNKSIPGVITVVDKQSILNLPIELP